MVHLSSPKRRDLLLITVLSSMAFFLDQMLVTMIVPILPAVFNTSTTLKESHFNWQSNQVSTFNVSTAVNMTILQSDQLWNLIRNKVKIRIGLLFGSKGVVQLFLNPLVGVMVDRSCPHIALAIGICVGAICQTLYALGDSYIVFFLARCLHGVATSCIGTGGLALLAENFRTIKMRGRMVGLVNVFLFVGGSLGPTYGGVMHQYVGRKLTFLLLLPFLFLCLLLVYIVWRNSREKCSGSPGAEIMEEKTTPNNYSPDNDAILINQLNNEQCTAPHGEVKASNLPRGIYFWKLVRDPYICVCAVGLFVANLSHNCLAVTLSIWMAQTFQSEEWQQGLVWFPSISLHMLGTAWAAFFCQRWPTQRHTLAIVGLVIGGLACLTLPFSNSWILVAFPVAFVFSSVAIADVTLLPLLSHIVDTRHTPVYGSVSAIAYMAFSIASVTGSMLSGWIYYEFGFFVLNAGLCVLCLLYSPILLLTKHYCE